MVDIAIVAKWFCRRSIFGISLLSPLGNGIVLHLNKLDIPSPKNALCQDWLILVDIDPLVVEKKMRTSVQAYKSKILSYCFNRRIENTRTLDLQLVTENYFQKIV